MFVLFAAVFLFVHATNNSSIGEDSSEYLIENRFIIHEIMNAKSIKKFICQLIYSEWIQFCFLFYHNFLFVETCLEISVKLNGC